MIWGRRDEYALPPNFPVQRGGIGLLHCFLEGQDLHRDGADAEPHGDLVPHFDVIRRPGGLAVDGDETGIVMSTSAGTLVVTGEDLHIGKLSLDGGELHVDGRIDSLSYEDQGPARGGFFSRLFGSA